MKPLVVIPSFVRAVNDIEVLRACVQSIRATEGDRVDVVVVDDGSPALDLVRAFEPLKSRWAFDLVRRDVNGGFSRAVNVGLKRALEEGRDAVLVNADIEFFQPWLAPLLATERIANPGLADVVGAMLLYPSNGLIQHGGVYFSLLSRMFNHAFQYAPADLPEAQIPSLCPVTAALQLIRHETLTTVGLYDEEFRLGFEDMDFCIRVMLANGECIYNPAVRAYHHESMFRGRQDEKIKRWHNESYMRLMTKYRDQSFAGLVPTL